MVYFPVNVDYRAAVNGSTPSLTDDLDIEPPQKAKANCQYSHCRHRAPFLLFIVYYSCIRQSVATDHMCAA